jgi:hypothetical protein
MIYVHPRYSGSAWSLILITTDGSLKASTLHHCSEDRPTRYEELSRHPKWCALNPLIGSFVSNLDLIYCKSLGLMSEAFENLGCISNQTRWDNLVSRSERWKNFLSNHRRSVCNQLSLTQTMIPILSSSLAIHINGVRDWVVSSELETSSRSIVWSKTRKDACQAATIIPDVVQSHLLSHQPSTCTLESTR